MDLTSTSPSVAAVVETTTTTTIPGSIAQATTTTEATTERESTYWEWDNGDEGSKSVHVGDHMRITLDIDADL